MARYLDSVCKLCRREGMKLYLKGSRCVGDKCPLTRNRPAPGMHGYRRGKPSEYAIRLREKQKVKRFYGVLEKQFRRYFAIASRARGNTGEVLMSLLERRLDNIVHRLGWAPSRKAARQLVTHGHVLVNGRKCDIPSRLLKKDDVIKIKPRPKALKLVKEALSNPTVTIPDFLQMTSDDPPEGVLARLPGMSDVDERLTQDKELNVNLIIEFCSR